MLVVGTISELLFGNGLYVNACKNQVEVKFHLHIKQHTYCWKYVDFCELLFFSPSKATNESKVFLPIIGYSSYGSQLFCQPTHLETSKDFNFAFVILVCLGEIYCRLSLHYHPFLKTDLDVISHFNCFKLIFLKTSPFLLHL